MEKKKANYGDWENRMQESDAPLKDYSSSAYYQTINAESSHEENQQDGTSPSNRLHHRFLVSAYLHPQNACSPQNWWSLKQFPRKKKSGWRLENHAQRTQTIGQSRWRTPNRGHLKHFSATADTKAAAQFRTRQDPTAKNIRRDRRNMWSVPKSLHLREIRKACPG